MQSDIADRLEHLPFCQMQTRVLSSFSNSFVALPVDLFDVTVSGLFPDTYRYELIMDRERLPVRRGWRLDSQSRQTKV